MTSLEVEIAELQNLHIDQLRKRWQRVFNVVVPKGLSRDLMVRGLSYSIQERIDGGLKQSGRRKLQTFARQLQTGKESGFDPRASLKPGTRLIRAWQGKTIEVLVLEGGFEFDGQRYSSLSKIACLVTGTRWSGPRFFGLKKEARQSA